VDTLGKPPQIPVLIYIDPMFAVDAKNSLHVYCTIYLVKFDRFIVISNHFDIVLFVRKEHHNYNKVFKEEKTIFC